MILVFAGCSSSPMTYESEPLLSAHEYLKYKNSDVHSAKLFLRVDREEAVKRFEDAMAAYAAGIEKAREEIARAEEYLGRHPRENLFAEKLEVSRKLYSEAKSKYEAYVEFYRPYKADYEVEKRRAQARKQKFKELILSFIKALDVPDSRILISESAIYFVEKAVLRNGTISVYAHMAPYPDSKAWIDGVHARYSDQSLGVVHTQWDLPWGISAKQGADNLCTHVINVEDMELPATGVIDLYIKGSDFQGTLKIAYSGNDTKEIKAGTTTVLRGRRQGNHLFLPVRFGNEGNQFTRECMVDTGATLVTVSNAPIPIEITDHRMFSTANGLVKMPVGRIVVGVDAITKEVEVAQTTDETANLLGANFFEGFLFTMDLENSSMYLIKR